MKLNPFVLTGMALLFSMFANAQESYYHNRTDQDYLRGLELYENEKYSAAQQFFDQYIESYGGLNTEEVSQSAYYSAMCAIELLNNDAESRVQKYLNENPESPFANNLVFHLANYFYQRKSYSNALQYYERVDERRLPAEDRPEYYFLSGYCYFLRNEYDQARYHFSQIKDEASKYATPALYYYSHINYEQQNYETALEGFLKLTDDANFGPIVPYYVTQIYYRQGKFREVTEYAPSLMDKAAESRLSDLEGMLGASYVELGMYKEAIPYLESYMESGTSVSREDRYELAWAYYRTSDYEQAARLFSQVSGSNSMLGQNALYHLADCQIRLGDKNQARMAFSAASKLNFDEDIKQDALLNYALLTYELDYSPFNEAIQALNDYIALYPDAPRIDEAYNTLVMAYLNAKNYKLALASIDKIRDKNNEMKKAYQKIAYYRGLELFSNLDLRESIEMLSESVRYGVFDNELGALAHYWKGEAWYRLGDYRQAIGEFQSFLSQPGVSGLAEYPAGFYNMGYCYFNQKQYADARVWFSKYTGLSGNQPATMRADAYNRLGDCYYVQSDYTDAVTYYDNAIRLNTVYTGYAMFQKALALGVAGRDAEKLSVLDQLLKQYPNSSLEVDALFQMAETYVKMKQNDRAVSTYNRVIIGYPNSSYVQKSLVNLGLLYFNTGNTSEAIRCYKQAISEYPGTAEAENALLGLKSVYIDNDDVDAYYSYVGQLGILTSEDLVEQDALSFASAERIYMEGNYDRAEQSLGSYIENHPDGRYLLNAWFYLGDCHYRANEYEEALRAFDFVIGKPLNDFTEKALLGASRIRFRQENYTGAAEYYRKLEEVATGNSNLLEARIGLMRCYYLTEDYTRVPDMADKILLGESLSQDQEREARFLKAKSLLARDRQMLALDEFREVSREVISAEGAESKYRVAEIYYMRGELDEAEKVISDFADKTTPHQYWMAKSFLLWADIFADRGDDFQAVQTLQSLIDYYGNTEDGIIAQAKDRKSQLEKEQEQQDGNREQQEYDVELE